MTYLLFGGCDYYPCGGAHDLLGAFDTLDEAKAFMDDRYRTHIVPAQPARHGVEVFTTTATLGSIQPARINLPAEPKRAVIRWHEDWAHVVHDRRVVAAWNGGVWRDPEPDEFPEP